jgi:Family of unknown function (DUF6184)
MRTNIEKKRVMGLVFAAGATLFIAACAGEDKSQSPERSPNDARVEPPVPVGSAVDSIVQARCDREARCNNIGTDREYTNRDACLSEVRADWRDDLNFTDCPGGVDSKELNECMEEIRAESCGNPFDTLGRLVACRSSDLCRSAH